MADTASFDITSTIDFAEVDNALNQARKEVGQRYDFKGAGAEIDLKVPEKTLTLITSDEMKMNALWEIVQTRLVRHAHSLGFDANLVLARYAAERLLYRLSRSARVAAVDAALHAIAGEVVIAAHSAGCLMVIT